MKPNHFSLSIQKRLLCFSSMQLFLHSVVKLFLHFLSMSNHIVKSESLPPSLPLKTRIALAVASAITDTVIRNDGTVNRRLINFLDIRAPANPNPINSVKTFDVTVDHSRDLWFRIFVPTNYSVADLPVIVFFHGGGFVFLSPDHKSFDAVCRRFARKISAIVVSVNYRLAPEYRYPAQYDDCFDVLKFLDEDTEWRRFVPENVDLSTCFLTGDSAGANIAHHVAKKACQSKFSQVKVVGLVSIQPFFGGEERTEAEKRMVGSYLVSVSRTDWMWKAFLPSLPLEEGGGEMNRDHEVINVSGPKAADLSLLNFPATMVVVGGLDPLQDWQRRYYHWLIRCGKEAYLFEYPTMIHAFYVFPELPQSAELISQIADFIRKHRAGQEH